LTTSLGLLSTDLINQGMSQMASLSSFGTSILGYASGAQSMSAAAQAGAASQQAGILGFMAPQADISALYSAGFGGLMGGAVTQLGDVYGLAGQTLSASADLARSNAEARVSILTSGLSAAADTYGYQAQVSAAEE
jgi:hypothetical protein